MSVADTEKGGVAMGAGIDVFAFVDGFDWA